MDTPVVRERCVPTHHDYGFLAIKVGTPRDGASKKQIPKSKVYFSLYIPLVPLGHNFNNTADS